MTVDEVIMQLFLWIKRGVYKSAGKRFGWKGPGIGVNTEILKFCDRNALALCIILGERDDRYYKARLSASDLLALTERYQSWEEHDGVEIRILPFTGDLFETVINPEQVRIVLSYLEDDKEES